MIPNDKRTLYSDPDKKPAMLAVKPDGIPEELRRTVRWMLWKLEWKKDRWSKVPKQANGRNADATKPATWAGFDAVREAYGRGGFDGVGFALGDGYAGIDLDNCRNPETGILSPLAQRIIDDSGSFAEVSPSGSGAKIFGRGKWEGGWHKKPTEDGGEIEVYDSARYFALTGIRLNECGIGDIGPLLALLALEYGEPPKPPRDAPPPGPHTSASDCDDAEVIRLAMKATNGGKFSRLWLGDTGDYGGDESRADLALCGTLAFYCGLNAERIDRLFRQSGLMRPKWDSARKDSTYGRDTIAKALEGKSEFYTPGGKGNATSAKPGPGTPSPVERSAVVRCMADVEARPVDWLWLKRLPVGRIALVAGDAGNGKTFVAVEIAAHVSTGRDFPDGAPCPLGSVLIVSAEDDPHDTIRPRLDVAGADVNKVHILEAVEYKLKDAKEERAFTLADMPALEEAVRELDDCRLLIIDPIGSYLGGGTDANQDNKVRAVLTPVAALAAKYKLAVVVIAHTRKSDANSADDKVLGSRAFTALARAVWHVSLDPEDKDRRLFLPGKSNLSMKAEGLAYRIEGQHHEALNDDVARVVWEAGAVAMTADDANFAKARNDAERKQPGPRADTRQQAAQWLGEQLAAGPRTPGDLEAQAEKAGHKWRTVQRAKEDLGIESYRTDFGGGTLWRFPEPPDAPATEAAAFRAMEPGRPWLKLTEVRDAMTEAGGKPVRAAFLLSILNRAFDEKRVDRRGEGKGGSPYQYRIVAQSPSADASEEPAPHSCQDSPTPACQDPQGEKNLASWRDCENKAETPVSDLTATIPAKLPEPGTSGGKPKRKRTAKRRPRPTASSGDRPEACPNESASV